MVDNEQAARVVSAPLGGKPLMLLHISSTASVKLSDSEALICILYNQAEANSVHYFAAPLQCQSVQNTCDRQGSAFLP